MCISRATLRQQMRYSINTCSFDTFWEKFMDFHSNYTRSYMTKLLIIIPECATVIAMVKTKMVSHEIRSLDFMVGIKCPLVDVRKVVAQLELSQNK